jgi:hypothetical protein
MATLEERINNLTGEITGRTKGPISDKEMEMFNQATGNVNSTENLLKQRAAKLMEEVNFLKGVGAISDREIEIFMQSGSVGDAQKYLTNLKMNLRSSGRLPSDTDIAKGAMSNREMEIFNNAMPSRAMTPQPMEKSIQQIKQNFDNSIELDKDMQEVEAVRQNAIQEIFMPLANEGYGDMVNTLLTKPMNSEQHTQAQMALARILQSEDPEFDANEFNLIVKMVSREPRPADLINREGLPDAPPQSQEGIGTLR